MSFQEIKVLYVNGKLEVDLPSVEISKPGDILVWHFRNLPPDSFAEVDFAAPDAAGGFEGPFETLVTGSRTLMGLGLSPKRGELFQFPYTLSVQRWDSKLKKMEKLAVRELQLTDQRKTSLVVTMVTVQCGSSLEELVVTPNPAVTCVGAPMNWDFGPAIAELPKDRVYRPRVVFESGPLGPYSDIATIGNVVSAVDRPDREGSPLPGAQFHYDVQIESVSGEVLRLAADLDPVIDDEGDPPKVFLGSERTTFASKA